MAATKGKGYNDHTALYAKLLCLGFPCIWSIGFHCQRFKDNMCKLS